MASENNPFGSTTLPKKESKEVKVKFNFPLQNPKHDFSIAMKKAKEEKSYVAFEMQNHIDNMTVSSVYMAGKVYDVPMEFYEKFLGRTVETSNPIFGNFQGKALEFVKRPKLPYMIKVDNEGNPLDPMEIKLDLYSNL